MQWKKEMFDPEITIKHYYCFTQKANERFQDGKLFWDELREDKSNVPFFIPENRADWLESISKASDLEERAQRIGSFAKEYGSKLFSFGVGNGSLEYNIKKFFPHIHLVCSDFAPRTISRLKKVFVEADELFVFDMLNDKWENVVDNGLVLLNRVDTEFDDQQWKAILSNMKKGGVKSVLFVPSDVLSLIDIIVVLLKYGVWKLMGKKSLFCGYKRTLKRFKQMFSSAGYLFKKKVNFNNAQAFLIEVQ